ncbi:MAG: hypothetical protein ACFB9M_12695 [Myxococcota bacterium]
MMLTRPIALAGLMAACVPAGPVAHGEGSGAQPAEHEAHEDPSYEPQAVGLPIPPHASDAERLRIMESVFARRLRRLDWKSDSVVKRIRFALEDARGSQDPEVIARRLDDAQRLLERF